jgi:hypothetical protein
VLRDALLWAFQDLPDPFLGFQASDLNSSTKDEAALVLGVMNRVLAKAAGQHLAPGWITTHLSMSKAPGQVKWEQKFRANVGLGYCDGRPMGSPAVQVTNTYWST